MSGDEGSDTSLPDEPRRQVREWLLLRGNRAYVTGLAALVLFAFFAMVTHLASDLFQEPTPLYYVFSGLIGGNITIVTVVVSINQLLVSRELQTPDELRAQIEGIIDYRRGIETRIGQTVPVEPIEFLQLFIEDTRQSGQQLAGLTRVESSDIYAEVDSIVSEFTAHSDRVDELLDESDVGTFRALSMLLRSNYAHQFQTLRRIQADETDQLPDEVADAMDDFLDRLEDIDTARQYFKTIAMQDELASLSQYLLYVGIGSVAVLTAVLVVLTAPAGPRGLPGFPALFISAIITVGFLPLALLFAYILRVTTITKRTVATLPFTSPSQEQ